jgi:hypothetical protein
MHDVPFFRSFLTPLNKSHYDKTGGKGVRNAPMNTLRRRRRRSDTSDGSDIDWTQASCSTPNQRSRKRVKNPPSVIGLQSNIKDARDIIG